MVEILDYIKSLGNNVVLSGGAAGSDTEWGNAAQHRGDSVIHWSFDNHRTSVSNNQIINLTTDQLQAAYPAVIRANTSLKRRFPCNSQSTNNLLCRNWYQVANTDAVYAISDFDSKRQIKGGTAWALQMYIDRFIYDNEDLDNCKLYTYSYKQDVWWQWKNEWQILTVPPPSPTGLWTGIGSRDLHIWGKWQIRKLMGTAALTSTDIEEMFPIITIPKINDIIYVSNNEAVNKNNEFVVSGWGKIHNIQNCKDNSAIIKIAELPGKEFYWQDLVDQQFIMRQNLALKRTQLKFN